MLEERVKDVRDIELQTSPNRSIKEFKFHGL